MLCTTGIFEGANEKIQISEVLCFALYHWAYLMIVLCYGVRTSGLAVWFGLVMLFILLLLLVGYWSLGSLFGRAAISESLLLDVYEKLE